jgi:NitT/TauT family transport system ATP-binding protein
LRATRLSFSRGSTRVLAGVELSVAREEVVCLIGASGSGKSTLVHLLAGLLPPDSGEVTVHARGPQNWRAKASVVFQTPALLPWLSVADNVAFGLDFACRAAAPRVPRKARVEQALNQVGLAQHANKRPNQLSGGMAQRAALARALARDPEIIFLDEPFSSLDAVTRVGMQDLLLTLARRQRSAVFLVTHDIDEALRIADRIVLLGGSPSSVKGEWRVPGQSPRRHRSSELNAVRDELIDALSQSEPQSEPALLSDL